MKSKFTSLGISFIFLVLINNTLKSQNDIDTTKNKFKLNLTSDIVSRYYWRGSDYGNSPAVQPTLSLSVNNFEVGCWGSVATNSFYKEIDLYAKYTYKKLSFILTDYYIPSTNGSPASSDIRYFTFKDKTTAHSLEGSLMFKGGEKFPIWILGGVYFYGNDKRWGYDASKDLSEKTYYSSYFEAGYTFAVQENSIDVILGITPSAGAYGNKAGIVNMGISGYRKIKISESFELPMKASLLFNPQQSTAFFILGITL
ncbi:MAG: hypothetical protein ACOYO1_01280 [Bacteroidales bacterium]